MGKRGDKKNEASIPVGADIMKMVEAAARAHGKSMSPPATKRDAAVVPVATPARATAAATTSTLSKVCQAAGTPAKPPASTPQKQADPNTPAKQPMSETPVSMSVQSVVSMGTPLVSPDHKRLKLLPSTESLPSMPSAAKSSTAPSTDLRHVDTMSTISLTDHLNSLSLSAGT